MYSLSVKLKESNVQCLRIQNIYHFLVNTNIDKLYKA